MQWKWDHIARVFIRLVHAGTLTPEDPIWEEVNQLIGAFTNRRLSRRFPYVRGETWNRVSKDAAAGTATLTFLKWEKEHEAAWDASNGFQAYVNTTALWEIRKAIDDYYRESAVAGDDADDAPVVQQSKDSPPDFQCDAEHKRQLMIGALCKKFKAHADAWISVVLCGHDYETAARRAGVPVAEVNDALIDQLRGFLLGWTKKHLPDVWIEWFEDLEGDNQPR